MFKKVNRLTKPEFDEVYKTGKKKHFAHLTIITISSDTTKVAVVAGKKVAKSAVRRNLLRKRVYSLLRIIDTNHPLGTCVVILKPSFNTLPRKTAEEIVRQSIAEVTKSA